MQQQQQQQDKLALKRHKNNLAAQRYRQRRKQNKNWKPREIFTPQQKAAHKKYSHDKYYAKLCGRPAPPPPFEMTDNDFHNNMGMPPHRDHSALAKIENSDSFGLNTPSRQPNSNPNNQDMFLSPSLRQVQQDLLKATPTTQEEVSASNRLQSKLDEYAMNERFIQHSLQREQNSHASFGAFAGSISMGFETLGGGWNSFLDTLNNSVQRGADRDTFERQNTLRAEITASANGHPFLLAAGTPVKTSTFTNESEGSRETTANALVAASGPTPSRTNSNKKRGSPVTKSQVRKRKVRFQKTDRVIVPRDAVVFGTPEAQSNTALDQGEGVLSTTPSHTKSNKKRRMDDDAQESHSKKPRVPNTTRGVAPPTASAFGLPPDRSRIVFGTTADSPFLFGAPAPTPTPASGQPGNAGVTCMSVVPAVGLGRAPTFSPFKTSTFGS